MTHSSLFLTFCAAALLASAPLQAKNHKTAEQPAAETETASELSGFAVLQLDNSKLTLSIAPETLGRRLFICSTTSQSSNYDICGVGFRTRGVYGRFERQGDRILLRRINTDMSTADVKDQNLVKRMGESHLDWVVASFPIQSESDGRISIDVTDFLMNSDECSPLSMNFTRAKGSINKALSYPIEAKSFEQNVFARTLCTFNYTDRRGNSGKASVEMAHSILLLPEKLMRPRFEDPRVGLFTQEKHRLDFAESDKYQESSFVQRYRVEPSDWAAFKRGELVEPVKPIVYYIDNEFPEGWYQAFKDGIEQWNVAFEAIGLKNVMQVRPYPTKEEDPDFDVDNLAYSCVRWIPTDRGGSMGPSWYDPETGEVINSSVYVWGSLIESQSRRAFVQTAQANPAIRSGHFTGEDLYNELKVIMTHEVGHNLGLAHNMASSSCYTLDQLRDPEFVKTKGLASSVMDYIYFNYIITPDMEGKAAFTSSALGDYDKMLIKYIYTPVDTTVSLREDAAICGKFIDEKSGDPVYRYVVQQWGNPKDPTAVIDDISDDPVEASRLAYGNLQYVLEHMNEWLTGNDQSRREYREFVYAGIEEHYKLMLKHVATVLGGVQKAYSILGTKGYNYKVIDPDYQRKALENVSTELRRATWIDYAPVRSQFQATAEPYSADVINSTVDILVTRMGNVEYANSLLTADQKAYTLASYVEDLYNDFFQKVTTPTATEQAIQLAFVTSLSKDDKEASLKERGAHQLLRDRIRTWAQQRSKLAKGDLALHYESLLKAL